MVDFMRLSPRFLRFHQISRANTNLIKLNYHSTLRTTFVLRIFWYKWKLNKLSKTQLLQRNFRKIFGGRLKIKKLSWQINQFKFYQYLNVYESKNQLRLLICTVVTKCIFSLSKLIFQSCLNISAPKPKDYYNYLRHWLFGGVDLW